MNRHLLVFLLATAPVVAFGQSIGLTDLNTVNPITGAKSFGPDKLCINGAISGSICLETSAVAGSTPFNIGTGGALGSAAFTSSSAYAPATAGTNLLKGDGAGGTTSYAGTSCTNQFPRALSAAGVATCATVANTDLANSSMTIAGTSVSLGGSISLDTITGLSSTGIVKRSGTNTLAIASQTGTGTTVVVQANPTIDGPTVTSYALFPGTGIWNATGLGIGTVSPQAKLDVHGSVLAAGSVTATSTNYNGTTTGNALLVQSGNGSGTSALIQATKSGGSLADDLNLQQLGGDVIVGGSLNFINEAAPSSPATGRVATYADSTDLRFHDKNASGSIGTTVVADTGSSNNFLTAISAAGVISKAQPAFSNLSGSVACSQTPALTGDVTTSAGSCSTTLGNIPAGTTMAGRVVTTAIAAPSTPSAGTGAIYVDSTSKNIAVKDDAGTVKHGVQTKAATTSQFLTAINDAGAVTAAQPAFSDLSGSVACSQRPALTGVITTSAGSCATSTGAQTGTGSTFVMSTAPTIAGGAHTGITNFGLRSSGSGAFDLTIANTENLTAARSLTVIVSDASRAITLNGNPTLSGLTTTGTGTLALGSKTLTVSNTLTLAGTDSTTMTFPSTSATIARTDAGQTFTGTQTFGALSASGAVLLGPPLQNNGSRVNLSGDASGGVATLDLIDISAGTGSQTIAYIRRNTTTIVGSIATTNTSTAYNTSSDARLKTDRGLATDLFALRALKIHDFDWKRGGSGRGVFAQEAYALFPGAVTPGGDTLGADGLPAVPWTVDYSKFVPDLIAGWQAHEKRIADLEARVAALSP